MTAIWFLLAFALTMNAGALVTSLVLVGMVRRLSRLRALREATELVVERARLEARGDRRFALLDAAKAILERASQGGPR